MQDLPYVQGPIPTPEEARQLEIVLVKRLLEQNSLGISEITDKLLDKSDERKRLRDRLRDLEADI